MTTQDLSAVAILLFMGVVAPWYLLRLHAETRRHQGLRRRRVVRKPMPIAGFRGDLPSADNALSPDLQLKLFLKLTKGRGTVDERHAFTRETLELITNDGTRNLFEGLNTWELVKDGELNDPAIDDINRQVTRRMELKAAGLNEGKNPA